MSLKVNTKKGAVAPLFFIERISLQNKFAHILQNYLK